MYLLSHQFEFYISFKDSYKWQFQQMTLPDFDD